MSPEPQLQRIALLGYGEVGQILATDLQGCGVSDVSAWDCLFPLAGSGPRVAANAANDVRCAQSMGDALTGRTLVISAVTAANCLPAAREAAQSLIPGAYYFDLNSAAPATKRAAAGFIEAAGGHYVEASVMSPISPKRSASPMLLGGPRAAGFESLAHVLGFTGARFFDATLGKASAAKMCRSVMIKGLESLLTESLLAARHHRVEAVVLDSLSDLLPGIDWERLAGYMIGRSQLHGRRRAEEMREAARAVAESGLEPLMSLACAARQDWAATHRPARPDTPLDELLDATLATLRTDHRVNTGEIA